MITEEDLVGKLNVLDATGQYDELLYQTDIYLKENPDLGILYLYKGNALREKGDLDGALSAYRWAIMYDPNDAAARTNYAAVLYSLKDYVGALNAADAAIMMEPDFPDAYLISGNVLSLLGFPEQAMYAYHHAFEFTPNNIVLGAYVAELYSKQDEPEEAFNLLMRLLTDHPKNAALHLQMAVALAFFMQNGVQLKVVDDYVKRWQSSFEHNPFVREIAPALLQHNMGYTPLTLERLQAAFDDMAPIYDEANQDDAITFINMLENALRPVYEGQENLRVLDIGCGTGLGAYPMREYTKQGQLIGVDLSQKLLEIARAKNIYLRTEMSDVLYFIEQEKASFDALIASESVPFFKDLEQAFAAFNKALKVGGYFFFSVKRNSLNNDDVVLYPQYNYIFSESYVRTSLEKNGFEIQSVQSMQDGSDEIIHDKRYFYVVRKIK